MTDAEKRRLMEQFLNGQLSQNELGRFRIQLKQDEVLRDLLRRELELMKSLDPDGDYQKFKEQLEMVNGEFFGSNNYKGKPE